MCRNNAFAGSALCEWYITLTFASCQEEATERAEEAAERAEEVTKYAQVLAEKLRSLGINPDEL